MFSELDIRVHSVVLLLTSLSSVCPAFAEKPSVVGFLEIVGQL